MVERDLSRDINKCTDRTAFDIVGLKIKRKGSLIIIIKIYYIKQG